MVYVAWALAGFAFGAADQYLGSRISVGIWAVAVSAMSAPWLGVPFVAGMTKQGRRRAMTIGLTVTLSALVGYFVLTCSPMENVAISRFTGCTLNVARTGYNPLWILGGIVFGPLYALLGSRWRSSRSVLSAACVASAFCLEPIVRRVVGMLSPSSLAWTVEVGLGLAAAAVFAVSIATWSAREKRPAVS